MQKAEHGKGRKVKPIAFLFYLLCQLWFLLFFDPKKISLHNWVQHVAKQLPWSSIICYQMGRRKFLLWVKRFSFNIYCIFILSCILCILPLRIKNGECQVSKTFSYKMKSVMFYNWLPILWTEYHVRTFPAIHSAINWKEGALIMLTIIYFLKFLFTTKLSIIIQGEFITCNMPFEMQYSNRLKEYLHYIY